MSELEEETRATFSATQRRSLFKKLLDNVKADDKRANLRMRKKVSENMSNMVQAQNDSAIHFTRFLGCIH